MDNVSHTIAGLLVAEAALQLRTARLFGWGPRLEPSRSFSRAAFWVSALANNLPDLDFIYSGITGPRPLGYLLHHRGHTHTLAVALALGTAMLGAWALVGKKFRTALQPGEWRWLVGLALFGSVLHIAMDFTNNYGVHPFWPLHNGWLYGDFIFIVEPLFFAIGIPPLLFILRAKLMRFLLGIVLVGILTLSWMAPRLAPHQVAHPVSVAFVVSLVTLAALLVSMTQTGARRIGITCVAAALVVLTFFAAERRARALASASIPEKALLQDVVLTPSPANPFCWSMWRISLHGSWYVAERGVVAPFPAISSARACFPRESARAEHTFLVDPLQTTAELTRVGSSSSTTITNAWFRAPVAQLAKLDRENCFVSAFLRYARAPFWTSTSMLTDDPFSQLSEGEPKIVGDLRYDRGPEIEFAEMVLPKSADCPRFVPSWRPPRHELLSRPP